MITRDTMRWRQTRRDRRAVLAWAALAASSLAAPHAMADRYEATVAVRPLAGHGRIAENAIHAPRDASASSYGGGGALTAGYGVRNWLDVGAELSAAGFGEVTYDESQVTVMGIRSAGRVTRASRFVQFHMGPTVRLGVAWVPTVYLGVGVSARVPTTATLVRDGRNDPITLVPDGMAAGVQLDACAAARVGFEHRLTPRWSAGVAAGATRTLGFTASPMQVIWAGLSVSYTWYPGWW
jgi:hypothetical protein